MKSQELRIFFLNARFFPVGGTAIRTLGFARALRNQNQAISILTWQPTDTEESQSVSKISALIKEGFSFEVMCLGHQFLRKHLRLLYLLTLMTEYATFVKMSLQNRKVDIVHCANDTMWISAFLKLSLRKTVIADVHAIPVPPGLDLLPVAAKRLINFVSKFALHFLDKFINGYITPTMELRELLVSWGIKYKKIRVIPNAVFAPQQKANRHRSVVRGELGVDQNTPLVVFHGILTENYNIESLKKLSDISLILKKKENT